MEWPEFFGLQSLARSAQRAGWVGAEVDVFVDALIEKGRIPNAGNLSREALAEFAADWANENALRGSGRTTRTLRDALESAAEGLTVIVLAVDAGHVERLERTFSQVIKGLAIPAGVIARVRIMTTGDSRRDRSLFRGAVIFEDHYTKEVRRRRARGGTSLAENLSIDAGPRSRCRYVVGSLGGTSNIPRGDVICGAASAAIVLPGKRGAWDACEEHARQLAYEGVEVHFLF